MGTHDLCFLRNFFANLQVFVFDMENFGGYNFQPCNRFTWFRGSNSNLLLSKLQ